MFPSALLLCEFRTSVLIVPHRPQIWFKTVKENEECEDDNFVMLLNLNYH